METLVQNFWGRVLVALIALLALAFIVRPAVVVTTAKFFGDESGSSQLYIEDDGPTPIADQ
jgi:hypothetical protein